MLTDTVQSGAPSAEHVTSTDVPAVAPTTGSWLTGMRDKLGGEQLMGTPVRNPPLFRTSAWFAKSDVESEPTLGELNSEFEKVGQNSVRGSAQALRRV